LLNYENTIGVEWDFYQRAPEGSKSLVSCPNAEEAFATEESGHYSVDERTAPTILVVDDQAQNRELLQSILVDHKFKVLAASDGAKALCVLSEAKVDLVLLDVLMPGESGFEVCREIKSNPLTYLIPVVFVTALSDKESRIRGIHAGADDLLISPVDPIELLARVRSLVRLKHRTDELDRAESVLLTLASIVEARDPNTCGHCERISYLSMRLGEDIGLQDDQVRALRLAGVVHDIGKVKVADSILLKPGPLSCEEWVLMREHPVVGERICAPLKSFGLVLPIIRHHHEKQDGSGYPDGLGGDEIPIAARILQVVDVYDALKSVRPYKCAMSTTNAIQTMREEVRKGWWDPFVLDAFEHLLDRGGPDLESLHKSVEYLR
jgi:putative two-component system response regulator